MTSCSSSRSPSLPFKGAARVAFEERKQSHHFWPADVQRASSLPCGQRGAARCLTRQLIGRLPTKARMQRMRTVLCLMALSAFFLLLFIAQSSFAQAGDGTSPPKAVTSWLQQHAVVLGNVEPSDPLDDLQALGTIVGTAHLVAVGEETHGTSEFFKMKHRIFEYLVSRMDFSAFAMETDFAEGARIDRFLQTGEGTAEDVAIGTRFWTWSTAEIAAMFQWMRDYNSNPAHPRKIRFYGVDMQFPDSAGQYVLAYLARVDPGAVAAAQLVVQPFASLFSADAYANLPQSQRDADAAAIAALIAHFDALRDVYIAASDEESWAFARQAAVVVGQAQQSWSYPDAYGAIRDESMAKNALWALQRSAPDGRMMLWAHNGHVASGPVQGGDPPMGQHLRASLGDDLLVIGQFFDHGSFVALDVVNRAGQRIYGLLTFTVGRSIEGSINDALASAKLPLYLVDIRNVRNDKASGAWWQQPHWERLIGALFGPAFEHWTYGSLAVPDAYDVLLYTETSTPAATLCDLLEGFCIKNQF